MILAVTLAAVVLLSAAAAVAWSARLIRVGHLDAQALAAKLAVPNPVSALDWPERRRQSLERVPAVLVAEDAGPGPSPEPDPGRRPGPGRHG